MAAKTVSNYKENVLNVNAKLKAVSKSLGYCRSVLTTNAKEIGLNPFHKKMLTVMKKNSAAYKFIEKEVRVSKSGNHSPFYLLQLLNNADFQEKFQNNFMAEKA